MRSDKPFGTNDLRRLGLPDGSRPVFLGSVSLPLRTVPEGKGRPQALLLSAGLAAVAAAPGTRFDPLGLPDEVPGRLAVARGTTLVRWDGPRDSTIEVLPGGTLPIERPPGRPDRVLWDASEGGEVAFKLPTGQAIVFRVSASGELGVWGVDPSKATRLAPIPAPPNEWLAQAGEAWLADRVRFHLAVGRSWHNAVAIGLLQRLPEAKPTSARDFLANLRAQPEPWRLAGRWLSGLDGDQVETMEDLAISSAEGLLQKLEDLSATLQPEAPAWRRRLTKVLLGRDDLDAVRVLLARVDRGTRLLPVLQALDDAGEDFLRSLPVALSIRDEQLVRAALIEPGAWWTRLALAP